MPNRETDKHHHSRGEKETEGEIFCDTSYSWFCCNCSGGPSDAEINDFCNNCQHLRCHDCLLGQQCERQTTLGTERRLLGSHLEEFFKIPTLAGDDEYYDEDDDDVIARLLGTATQPSLGESQQPAASDPRSYVDYMIVAERALGLGAGVHLDDPDYILTPELVKRQNVFAATSLSGLEAAHELPKLAARAREAYVNAASSSQNQSLAAADLNTKSSRSSLNDLEGAAKWKYRNINPPDNSIANSYRNEPNNYVAHLQDPEDFPLVWHHVVLPSLVRKLRTNYMRGQIGTDFTVVVLRGNDPKGRQISIMTEKPASDMVQSIISEHALVLFPPQFRSALTLESFSYRTGCVSRSNSVRGSSAGQLDDICHPRNPFGYREPRTGDSVGIAIGFGDDESTSTLGPCVCIGDDNFWLLNFHPFAIAYQDMHLISDRITLEHPSPMDRALCSDAGHGTLSQHSGLDFTLGDLILNLNSGPAYKTTRISREPYWRDFILQTKEVVTDWALCIATGPRVNVLRTTVGSGTHAERPITETSHINPGATVRSTGRTSGLQLGQIGFCPAFVSGGKNGNGTGRDTCEWFIEPPSPIDDENRWIKEGIGISGDSGAVVVDDATNALYGHIWGRNKYWGDGERVTYFTPILDVFNDIQKIFPSVPQTLPSFSDTIYSQQRPRLRHCDKDIGVIPSYPLCLACVQPLQLTATSPPSNTSGLRVKGSPVASDQATPGENDLLTPKGASSTVLQSAESPFVADFYTSLSTPAINSPNQFEVTGDLHQLEGTHNSDGILDNEVFAEDFQIFRSNARRPKRKLSVLDTLVRKNGKISN